MPSPKSKQESISESSGAVISGLSRDAGWKRYIAVDRIFAWIEAQDPRVRDTLLGIRTGMTEDEVREGIKVHVDHDRALRTALDREAALDAYRLAGKIGSMPPAKKAAQSKKGLPREKPQPKA